MKKEWRANARIQRTVIDAWYAENDDYIHNVKIEWGANAHAQKTVLDAWYAKNDDFIHNVKIEWGLMLTHKGLY